MKPEIKAEWIRRLRSGRYKQGQAALRRDDEYCCLGVLCEMGVEEGIVTRIKLGGGSEKYAYNGMTSYLPFKVREWADLPGQNPVVSRKNANGVEVAKYLSEINDEGASFAEIADLIERHLPEDPQPATNN